MAGRSEHELPGAVLAVAVARKLVRAGGKVRTDPTHVLAAARVRVDGATEALRQAPGAVAAAEPQRPLAHAPPHWAEHCAGRGDWGRAVRARAAREGRARQLGADGFACQPLRAHIGLTVSQA